jgi:tetratricopeptide (TPR) repeat protein
MRSADRLRPLRRWLLLAALCAGLSGCASFIDAMRDVRARLNAKPRIDESAARAAAATPARPASAPQPAPAPAPAAVVATAAPVVAARPADVEVTPAMQLAFDEALKALSAGKTDDAERRFRAMVQAYPELGGPHANLGLIYRKAGKLPEALAEFELAVRASPQQPVYYNQLGITLRELGKFAQAREAYERAIALDGNHADAYLNLGILHDMYLADGARALEMYDRYLALSPGGDAKVAKWVADLKNRKPRQSAQGQPAPDAKPAAKEKP